MEIDSKIKRKLQYQIQFVQEVWERWDDYFLGPKKLIYNMIGKDLWKTLAL